MTPTTLSATSAPDFTTISLEELAALETQAERALSIASQAYANISAEYDSIFSRRERWARTRLSLSHQTHPERMTSKERATVRNYDRAVEKAQDTRNRLARDLQEKKAAYIEASTNYAAALDMGIVAFHLMMAL